MKTNKLILLSIFVSFCVVTSANSKSRCATNTNCVMSDSRASFLQKKKIIRNKNIQSNLQNLGISTPIPYIPLLTTSRMKTNEVTNRFSITTDNFVVLPQVSMGKGSLSRVGFEFPASREEQANHSESVKHYTNTKVSKNNNPAALLKAGRSALKTGDYSKAYKWLEQLLEIREAEGGESLELADALHEMGSLHLSLGRYDKAAPLFLRALSLKEKILTVEHPSDAKTRAKLGDLYKAKGELGKAESFYLRALSIYEKHSGLEEATVADIWMELGNIYLSKNIYDKAEKFYHRATAINKKVRGDNHPVIARINAKLAEIFTANGDLGKGERFYSESIAIAKESLGETHASYARAVKKLADFYKANAHYKNAEQSYQKALSVADKSFGEKHPFVAELLQSLAEVYEQLGDYKKSEAMKAKAIKIYQ